MNTTQNQVTDALTEAIKTIADSSVQSKDATLTIEAEIVDVIDEGLGIYKVKYLGNKFEATTAHTEVVYHIGDMVYVIVPNGNFDKNKIILSPIAPESATYAYLSDGTASNYVDISDNLFSGVGQVNLSTYNIISAGYSNNLVGTDNLYTLMTSSIKDSLYFKLTCKIQTNIAKERRTEGNYGLKLNLPIYKVVNGSRQEDSIQFVLDTNNMTGDPYNFEVPALQNFYFSLPKDIELMNTNYHYSNNSYWLSPFVSDFPGSNYSSTAPADIFITDIKLQSVLKLSEENMSGYYSIITATNGNIFASAFGGDEKTLTVTPYLKGKVIKNKEFACYWFKENVSITPGSEKYHTAGGRGWEILNSNAKSSISEGQADYQYITNKYTQLVKKEEIHSDTRFKCVLIKDEVKLISYITIKNFTSSVVFELSTLGTTVFSKNNGNITLEVKYFEPGITNATQTLNTVGYSWARYDKKGNYIDSNFFTTEVLNEQRVYNENVTYVDGHHDTYYYTRISFPINKIDEQNEIRCTAYLQTPSYNYVKVQTIATSSIVVNIKDHIEGSIVVENGDKLFKYDSDGISPYCGNYDGPISTVDKYIDPLNVKVFKADGTEFNSDEYSATTVTWLIPINSMIIPPSLDVLYSDFSGYVSTGDRKYDTTTNPGYYTIKRAYNTRHQLPYTIAKKYDYNKIDNTIIVKVSTPSTILQEEISTKVNFRFLKDGGNGTNGSKYNGVITYNGFAFEEKDELGKKHKLQLIYVADEAKWFIHDPGFPGDPVEFTSSLTDFAAVLYSEGETTYGSYSWSIFEESYETKYSDNLKPTSPIKIQYSNIIPSGYNMTGYNDPCGAILVAKIQCTESTQQSPEYVYAYYPIECIYVPKMSHLNYFLPSVEGGFTEVVYASDGTNPQWGNGNDFVMQNVYSLDDPDLSNYFYAQWVSSNGLQISYPTSYGDLKIKATPPKKFDNGYAKNYIGCTIYGRSTSSSSDTGIDKKISNLNNEKTKLVKEKEYYEYLQQNISSAFTLYEAWYKSIFKNQDSWTYHSQYRFTHTAPLYTAKANLMDVITQLSDQANSIYSLCEQYKNLENGSTDSNITPIYNEIKTKITMLESLANTCIGLGYTADGVLSMKNSYPSYFTLSNKINYEGTPSRSCYFSINDAIILYNNILNTTYSTCLDSLNDSAVTTGETAAIQITHWIDDFISGVALDNLTKKYNDYQTECYKYSGLIKVLESYILSVHSKSGVYSYNEVYQEAMDPINKNLSWYVTFNNSGGYTSKINDFTNQITELEKNIEWLTNFKTVINDLDSDNRIGYYRPIAFSYNRYEMSFLNGWDGNKLETGDGYIIAPQVGAGIKDYYNRFTGIVIGTKQVKAGTQGSVGLFGYNQGIQSIFLNARNGSATFGEMGSGQIIFEPTNKKAIIKSGNYNTDNSDVYLRVYSTSSYDKPNEKGWYEYAYSPTEQKYTYVLSEDTYNNYSSKVYYEKTTAKGGMLIDLTTPEIKFGTGNFVVNKEGHITAKGGGTIGGWNIGDYDLTSYNGYYTGKLTLHAGSSNYNDGTYDRPKIYSGTHDELASTSEGFYLGPDGLSITGKYTEDGTSKTSRIEMKTNGTPKIFTGGHDSLDSTSKGFYIGNDGFSVCSGSKGRIEMSTTGNPKLFSNSHNNLDSTTNGFYLSNDGLSIGSKVYIDNTGTLRLGRGAVENTGKHWTIQASGYDTSISYGSQGESGSVYIGTDKITLGEKFSVTNAGKLIAQDAEIYGKIEANSGNIAGWKISQNTLSSADGKIKINSGGDSKFIEGPNAYIDLEGGEGSDGTDFRGCHINAANVCFSAGKLWTTRSRGATTLYEGKDYAVNIKTGYGDDYIYLHWINGLLIDYKEIGSGWH